jgi:hypothetical protein
VCPEGLHPDRAGHRAGVIAILTAFFLPGMLKGVKTKLSTAITQLQKDFPGAIARQVSRTNTCSTTTITAAKLKERGLPDLTVWNTAWTVDAVTSNQVTISYTIDSTDTNAAADLATALNQSNNIVKNSATATGNTKVTVAYRCN